MELAATPVHARAIRGPGAWRRDDFSGPRQWTYQIPSPVIKEVDASIAAIRASARTLASIDRADFPLPSFRADAARLRRELASGRGFVLIRGLPIDRYTDDEATLAYWGLGCHLGTTLPQNVKGDRVYAVRDEGYKIERDYGAVGVRFSKTTAGVHFHTDSSPALMGNTPDVVGLLALRAAKSGGETVLVSAQTLHNILLEERPDLLERLYAPYHFDRAVELNPGESRTLFAPVFSYNGALAVRYFRYYIPKGHEAAGAPLTEVDIEALDYLESAASRPEVEVSFAMERGDIQFVSNTFVLHSRTPFEDHAEPDRRRHFVRLWLKLDE